MSAVDFSELQRLSHLKSKAAVRRYLDKLRIAYRVGSDGAPWTTTEALNRVLMPKSVSVEPNLEACGPRQRGRKAAAAQEMPYMPFRTPTRGKAP